MLQTIRKSDIQIQQDVMRELRWDTRIGSTEVGVEVDKGIVSLTGTVENFAKKHAATEAAHRVAGVLDVANDVAVADAAVAQAAEVGPDVEAVVAVLVDRLRGVADDLGSALRWEASRGGALFPHLTVGDNVLVYDEINLIAALCRAPVTVTLVAVLWAVGAATGARGVANAELMCGLLAAKLSTTPDDVLVEAALGVGARAGHGPATGTGRRRGARRPARLQPERVPQRRLRPVPRGGQGQSLR